MRKEKKTIREIAEALGISKTSAFNAVADIDLNPPPAPKPAPIKKVKAILDPQLKRRLRLLRERGFDVPPSKTAAYRDLMKAGYSVQERVKMLKLE